MFPKTVNGGNPVQDNLGLYEVLAPGMTLEKFKALKMALKPGSELSTEGESWGMWALKNVEAASLVVDIGFRVRTNGAEHMGRGLNQVQSIKRYRKIACELISFLIAIGRLSLPKFSEVDDGSRRNRLAAGEPPLATDYLEGIVLAVCKVSALDSSAADMHLFLQIFCLKMDADSELEPLSPQQVSQRTSALIYVIKDMWCALRSHLQYTDFLPNVEIEQYPELYRIVNSGAMDTCKPMIAVFTVRKLTGKSGYSPTIFVQENQKAPPEIPLAVWVNNKYITTIVIAALVYALVRSIKALHKAFFSLITVPYMAELIDGKHQMNVDDRGTTITWETIVPNEDNGGIGIPIVSEHVEEELAKKLKELPVKEFDEVLSKHLKAGEQLLVLVQMTQQCRGNELNSVAFSDYPGGGTKSLSYLQGKGDGSDTCALGVIRKDKNKFDGDNSEDTTMLGLLTPDVSLGFLFHLLARRALANALKHHYPGKKNEDMKQFLFISGSCEKLEDGDAANSNSYS